MILNYEQFKCTIFENRDPLKKILNLLSYMDKLQPITEEADDIISMIEEEQKNSKVNFSLKRKTKKRNHKKPKDALDYHYSSYTFLLSFLGKKRGLGLLNTKCFDNFNIDGNVDVLL